MKKKFQAPLAFRVLVFVASLSAAPPHVRAEGVENPPAARADSSAPQLEPSGSSAVAYFYEPFPLKPGSFVFQLGGSFSLLPYPDMEQELPVPALDVQYKHGILNGLALVANLSTSIYSNLLHAGLQVHTRIDRFSVGLGDQIGGVYGVIKREGVFDKVSAYALFDMLIVRFGYRLEDFSVSLSLATTYVIKSRSLINGMHVPGGPEGAINDYWCTWAIEQPFLKTLHIAIGMSLGYTRTPYQTWMLYSTTDEWLFAPEFFFAIQL